MEGPSKEIQQVEEEGQEDLYIDDVRLHSLSPVLITSTERVIVNVAQDGGDWIMKTGAGRMSFMEMSNGTIATFTSHSILLWSRGSDGDRSFRCFRKLRRPHIRCIEEVHTNVDADGDDDAEVQIVIGCKGDEFHLWKNPFSSALLASSESENDIVMSITVDERSIRRPTVNCILCLDDGVTIATATDGTVILLWRIDTGICFDKLRGHKRGVLHLSQMSDGRLISTSYDQMLIVWIKDTESGSYQIEYVIDDVDVMFYATEIKNQGLIVSHTFTSIQLWRDRDYRHHKKKMGHYALSKPPIYNWEPHQTKQVTSVATTTVTDEEALWSAGRDGTIRAWRVSITKPPELLFSFDVGFAVSKLVVSKRKTTLLFLNDEKPYSVCEAIVTVRSFH